MIDLYLMQYEGRRARHESKLKISSAISGLVGAGASIYSGISQANAAKQATNLANTTLSDAYANTQNMYSPYTTAGTAAYTKLANDVTNGTGVASPFTMSDFYSDPGYQFTLSQGSSAVNNSAAAKGGLLSGNAARSLDSYTTGLANQTYGDAYNRYLSTRQQSYNELSGVANMGLSATNSVANANQSTANSISNNYMNGLTSAAAANASGYVGAANAANSAIKNYTLSDIYRNMSTNGNVYSDPYSNARSVYGSY